MASSQRHPGEPGPARDSPRVGRTEWPPSRPRPHRRGGGGPLDNGRARFWTGSGPGLWPSTVPKVPKLFRSFFLASVLEQTQTETSFVHSFFKHSSWTVTEYSTSSRLSMSTVNYSSSFWYKLISPLLDLSLIANPP